MADGTGARASPGLGQHAERPQAANLQAVATDWITIWQSEIAALATDREVQEAWVRLVAVWAQTAGAAARLLPSQPRPPTGDQARRTGPAAQAGSTAPMASPDSRDATIQHLACRVEELERKLRALAAGNNDLVGNKPGR